MRTGGWTLQQALTADAANVVKQAVTLAKRRGHAQVTPLHVANTMLSSSTGLLRTACLQSHSHPLQCKALELCFNVALNRLPASTSTPMLGGHHSHHHPFLSNALVAAFKRAQAHQRRGSIENQQQPLLAVKVEIEQLIISILDDPSVSRVMREAGFSSTQVKSNVEQAVSLEICSQNQNQNPPLSSKPNKESSNLLVLGSSVSSHHQSPSSPPPPPPPSISQVSNKPRPFDQVRNEDVMSVLETLMHRRRSTVIVGEYLASIEGIVRGVMDKVEKGDVHEGLRGVQFISFPLFPFGPHISSKEDVEQKLAELRCLLKNCVVGQGSAVLYLGDLKWAAEIRASSSMDHQGMRSSYYCPVEHMIMELGRLVSGIESGRVLLMGIATFQTYMRCRIGNPSLEAIWHLHPLTIPAGSLSLSLNSDSDSQGQFRSKRTGDGSGCNDFSAKFNNEARSRASSSYNDSTTSSTTSSLPSWLKQYKEENKRLISSEEDCIQVRDLCHRWNSIGSSSQDHQLQKSEKTLNFPSISPPFSTSVSSHDHYYPNMHQTHHGWPIFAEPKQSWREHHFWISDNDVDEGSEPNLQVYVPNPNPNPYPSSTPNSASSSDAMEMEYHHRFKELNAENLKTLCNALEQKVPWQKEIIPEIASTILQCRSGLARRKDRMRNSTPKEDTCLFFHGVDVEGKEKIARELAGLVFGSPSHFISLGLSSFSSMRADSTDDFRNKRSRDESSCSYLERFAEAVCSNPHRVFLVEDIEQVDYRSQLGIKRAIERGRVTNSNGERVLLRDAIVILSCESFSSRSRACSPPMRQKSGEMTEEEKNGEDEQETSPCVSLDLNLSAEEEDHIDHDQSIDDIGLLESVDRKILFKLPDY
ncbi:protein SMAX1-LIKE 3-like [Macadamia integrifolia]|uniref:protein SMAX1-LIKE 3-like n=1 Tax=Macadamia integrifolia TaxID=60698 RepID=UPI001C4F3C4A|nr:protein SMAX1-LIKE 3-like [Macadamia integrifolia]